MGNDNNNSSKGSCCGGCLTALVIGTAIVGTIAVGGCSNAWYKLKSTWDYDNAYQTAQSIADRDKDGVVSQPEWMEAYHEMKLVTIEGQVPQVKIPYKTLVDFNEKYGRGKNGQR